ncbi:hypothetical protein MMC30_002230 [Trapelia coarctata]|nr:hypothetical protein [Trapelia coarctata]
MESRAPKPSLGLYRETRVDLEPVCPNSIVHLQLLSNGTFARTSRLQRRVVNALPASKKEEEFKSQHVASSSSVYFRKSNKYPRSFLWRCLEEDTTLELRSVDLSKDEHDTRNATLILRIAFPSPIRRGGVALADNVDHDVLSVFILTKSNEIYTLTLRPDFFCRPEASEDDVGRWCHIFKPSTFSVTTPHRLIASSSAELLVSLSDGRLLRLFRKSGEDGSKWEERAYNDGQWGASLRGLIRWQATTTVRHDGHVLDQNTILAAQSSPDHKHLLAVSLSHTLKAWNIDTGNPTFSRDLLNKEREPQEVSRIMLDPRTSKVMHVFEAYGLRQGDRYHVATFSPQDSGVFKFWGVRDADFPETGVRDLFPENTLKLPDPDDGALWTMADFHIKAARGSSDIDIWILVRLNRRYKLFSKNSNMVNLAEDWEQGWLVTVAEPPKVDEPPSRNSELDAEDSTEKWFSFLFTPGRVPGPILEAALSTYNETRSSSPVKSTKASLKERIASSVGSQFQLRGPDTDFQQFQEQTALEWTHFWSIVCDLDQTRWEPLSLGYDEHGEMSWLTFADGVSAIRHCGEVERLTYNSPRDLQEYLSGTLKPSIESGDQALLPQLDELAMLVATAAAFRMSFSENLHYLCRSTLTRELWQDSLLSVPERMAAFYESCKFGDEISDKQYDDLARGLANIGGFRQLTTEFIMSLLELLLQPMSTDVSGLHSTKFGLKLVVKGAQEMISPHLQILTDVLFMTVFLDMEIDREKHTMDDFNASIIYTEALNLLKQYQLMHWLATHTRPDPRCAQEAKPSVDFATLTSGNPSMANKSQTTTVLGNLFAVDMGPRSYSHKSQSETITGNIEDLLRWITGGNEGEITLEGIVVNIQCDFLKNNNIDLASSFLLFQPSTAWATYIRGRLCLLRSEFTEAAFYFKKAAYNLSNKFGDTARPNPHFSYPLASANFLDPLTASFLSSGLQNYYTHILSLFEPYRAHSHIMTFAQLALQAHPPPSTTSSTASLISSAEQHSDLLARLFHAALSIPDYEIAYSALVRYTNAALRENALKRMVNEMVQGGYIDELLALPWAGLRQEIDDILTEHAKIEGDAAGLSGTDSVPYYKILYAWRICQGDMRGAAAVMVERLEGRKERGRRKFGARREMNAVLEDYLVAINAFALVGEDEGWVLVGGREVGKKRKVVTVGDVRKSFQEELDRRSVLESGRFGIVGGADDEEEGDAMVFS